MISRKNSVLSEFSSILLKLLRFDEKMKMLYNSALLWLDWVQSNLKDWTWSEDLKLVFENLPMKEGTEWVRYVIYWFINLTTDGATSWTADLFCKQKLCKVSVFCFIKLELIMWSELWLNLKKELCSWRKTKISHVFINKASDRSNYLEGGHQTQLALL